LGEYPVCEDCSRRFDELVVVGGGIVLVLEDVKGKFDTKAVWVSYIGRLPLREHG
jgi:hypothetical protein